MSISPPTDPSAATFGGAPSLTEPPTPAAPLGPRAAARIAVGVVGDANVVAWKSAVPVLAKRRVFALAMLQASVTAPIAALLLLLPAVAPERGWSTTAAGGALIAGALVAALLSLVLSDRVPTSRRSRAGGFIAFNAAVLGLFLNLLPAFALFTILALARGFVLAQGASIWRPFAFEAVVPEARARAITRTVMGSAFGVVLGALCAYLAIDGPAIGTGQALALAGALGVALSLFTLRLSDTEVGGVEPARLDRVLGRPSAGTLTVRPSWRDSYASLRTVTTARKSLAAYVGVGWCAVLPLTIPVVRLAEEREFPARTPAIVVAVTAVVTILVLAAIARGLEKTRRVGPEDMAKLIPQGLLIGFLGLLLTGLVPFSLSPQLALAAIGAAIAFIALDVTVLSTLAPEDRPAFAGLSTFSLVGGGLLSLFVVSAVSSVSSYTLAFIVASIPVLGFRKLSRRIIRSSSDDLDAHLGVDDDTQGFEDDVEEQGGATPVLAARNIDFSYGSVQVLFDVSVRVNEGEMVALLGPNGVGKTTLLRVLSGLETPAKGSVRLDGSDVTDVTSSRRVAMGISQIVGGNATFGSMTVYENLQMYGFSMGRKRSEINTGIEEAFRVFPRLADRRNQLASTLSGGEQQMLGLSKALITKPKILVVDEFSLGLAPIIVGELLGMVRALNASGTAVLIVEQSVNVALNLVDRCYFMEKGQIVYEGRSADLLAQPELVQALSLGGHAETMEARA